MGRSGESVAGGCQWFEGMGWYTYSSGPRGEARLYMVARSEIDTGGRSLGDGPQDGWMCQIDMGSGTLLITVVIPRCLKQGTQARMYLCGAGVRSGFVFVHEGII